MASGWMHGLVKAVPSGDSVLVIGKGASQGPPPEKLITLASLIAPRLARREATSKDEQFAFDSREFLRKKLIGQQVRFRIEYSVAQISREFGQVYLGEENVSVSIVQSGWAKVRAPGGEQASNYEELAQAQQAAEAAGVGMWTKDPEALERAVRAVPEEFDTTSFLHSSKGKPIPAIVEAVLNGSCLRVQLLTDTPASRHATITVFLAGIQCPAMARRVAAPEGSTEKQPDPQPEPFAREAKHFTEIKLLHREVRVVLEGTDKYSNLHGTVLFAEGGAPVDVAEQLARHGLCKVVDWSAAILPGGAGRLRAAEREAKESRARLWRDYVAPPPSANSLRGNNFNGIVVEVVSGDVVVIADATSGAERRVNLSSIRAPRLGNERRGTKPEPYANEAKEFLRSRCIGHTVHVSMEYSRVVGGDQSKEEGAGGGPERKLDFGSVLMPHKGGAGGADGAESSNGKDSGGGGGDKLNLAEALVLRGLATVVRHRGDEERSTHYDALVAAEQRAVKGKKGVQNKEREPPVHHVNDVSQNANKAKQFLPFLQRAGRVHALVEFVSSGHRVKLHVPKEGATIAFALGGVRCPQREEAFAAQALSFTRLRCMQRECEVEVEAVDKTGTFLGNLFISQQQQQQQGGKGGGGSFNLAMALLQAGLGSLHPSFSPERFPNGREMKAAEDAAKGARVGMWKDWVEPSPEDEAAAAAAAEAEKSGGGGSGERGPAEAGVAVGVTEIVGGGKFFVQRTGAGSSADWLYSHLQEAFAGDDGTATPPGPFEPRAGDLVAGKFTGDGAWYRAVVTEPRRGAAPQHVFYCDFGNSEALPLTRLRPLSAELAAPPPQAHLCTLSMVRCPALDDEHGHQSAVYLAQSINGGAFTARVDQRMQRPSKPWEVDAAPELHVWLTKPVSSGGGGESGGEDGAAAVEDAGPSVNEAVVEAGLGRVEKWAAKRKAAALLLKAQESARAARAGVWEYGDVDSDDDEPAAPARAPGAWGRRR